MNDILLIGSEDVRSGGYAMQHAAAEMKSAAATIDYSLLQHRQWMDEWLLRFEKALELLQSAVQEPRA